MGIDYRELTHRIIEVEKSRDPQLMNWRPRRVNDISSGMNLKASGAGELMV